jgi:hypothetical protein
MLVTRDIYNILLQVYDAMAYKYIIGFENATVSPYGIKAQTRCSRR